LKADASGVVRARLALDDYVDGSEVRPAIDCSLVCSSEVQGYTPDNPEPVPGYGWSCNKTSFTKYAREAIRCAGAVMDEWYGRQVLFVTLTLPGSTMDALQQLGRWSGYAMSRLRQHIRDNCESAGVIAVWEWQGRGALHLHLAVGHSDKRALDRVFLQFREWWCRLLVRIGTLARCDMFQDEYGESLCFDWHKTRQDVQWAEKTVGRYLSKYISKKASKDIEGSLVWPLSWWGMSNNLRHEVACRRLVAESPPLEVRDAQEIYEALVARLREGNPKVFEYTNQYATRERYMVALAEPESGAADYQEMVRQMFEACDRVGGNRYSPGPFDHLGHMARLSGLSSADAPVSLRQICEMFGVVKCTA